MIDFTKHGEKDLLQILKSNPEYNQVIANAKQWEEVVAFIDSLNIKYTEEQLNHIKIKQWL